MRKISVIISSLRPDRLEETINSTAMHSDLVEVVVASPVPPRPRDFVKHVPVPPPGDPRELTFTQKNNLAVQQASGEYLVYNNDDIHFRSGWASMLIEHMEKTSEHPYLACFHIAVKGKVSARHTAFGLLYANHGCVRKKDLERIGGKLFDERFYMYTSDIDIGLRVWYNGGRVGMCSEVVLDADRDIDQAVVSKESVYARKTNVVTKPGITYRDIWIARDSSVFRKIWFPRYFGLFLKNYSWLKQKLDKNDGVLSPKYFNSSLLKAMMWPVFNMFLNPKIFFNRLNKKGFINTYFVRVINRRWGCLDYESPYSSSQVSSKSCS